MRLNSGPLSFAAFLIVATYALPSATPAAASDSHIALPAPTMEGGMPLMDAISKRRSQRAFSDRLLEPQKLSDLLWAAFGINRPETGDRTAPSWRGSKETDIYVARADGVWLYAPEQHALRRVLETDLREQTGRQPFAAQAPQVLIYVADRKRMAEAPADSQLLYGHVNSALIAQNVYLFAASEGLATVMLGNVEKDALSAALGLREDQVLTFTQPVGYPR
ncbi:MAG: SagB/ThcOx family dehydrogenase [Rhodospirillaceae bacterium]